MKVTYKEPNLPDGYEISLTGLNAVLLNNTEVEIDDEIVQEYKDRTGKDLMQNRHIGGAKRKRKPKPKTDETDDTDENTDENNEDSDANDETEKE